MATAQLDELKLRLEIDELRKKLGEIGRPEWKKPTFWFTLTTTIVAVVGVVGQSYLSAVKANQADFEVNQAKTALDNANAALKVAEKNRTDAELATSNEVRLANSLKASVTSAMQKLQPLSTELCEIALTPPRQMAAEVPKLLKTISAVQATLNFTSVQLGDQSPDGLWTATLTSDPPGMRVWIENGAIPAPPHLNAIEQGNEMPADCEITPCDKKLSPGKYTVFFFRRTGPGGYFFQPLIVGGDKRPAQADVP
jgi:hypothetical protein